MATTNFKVFNEANDAANTYNDSEYQNATQRQTGVIPGMAISRMHNKMYFQWSTMATAIAQFLVSKGYDCMDDDIQGIQDALESVVIDDATKELYAKRDTAYSVGDTGLLIGIPAGFYLECTTDGTTATTAPTVTQPVFAGQTITDGTVVWTVRKDVNTVLTGYRQPNTAYALDDKTIHPDLPFGWYLRCTTPGTTDSTDITIPTPPSLSATINDGTVVWTLSNITQAQTNFNGQFLAGFSGLFAANADIYYVAGTFPTNPSTGGLPAANYGFLEIISSSPYGFNSMAFYAQIYTNIATNKRYIRSVFHPSSQGTGWSAWSALN